MTEFISIGPFCRTAIILKALNKRNCSYPFDYIFSSIKMVNHCIENEFKFLLDKSYISTINEEQSSHSLYDSYLFDIYNKQYRKVVFNHHNLLNDENYNKFKIRCQKFLNMINNKNNKVCLIYTIKTDEINIQFELDEYIKLSVLLPHINIIILNITASKEDIYNNNNLYIYDLIHDDCNKINEILNEFM